MLKLNCFNYRNCTANDNHRNVTVVYKGRRLLLGILKLNLFGINICTRAFFCLFKTSQ